MNTNVFVPISFVPTPAVNNATMPQQPPVMVPFFGANSASLGSFQKPAFVPMSKPVPAPSVFPAAPFCPPHQQAQPQPAIVPLTNAQAMCIQVTNTFQNTGTLSKATVKNALEFSCEVSADSQNMDTQHLPLVSTYRPSPVHSTQASRMVPRSSASNTEVASNPYSVFTAPSVDSEKGDSLSSRSTPQPTKSFSRAVEKDVLPKDTIHTGLAGVAGFLPYPSVANDTCPTEACPTEATAVTAEAPVAILFRNLPWYALRFRHIRWLARTLCQTEIFSPDVTNRRCLAMFCVAYVPSEEKAQRLLDLNGRILFDRTGVWVARTEEEKAALVSYCEAAPVANNGKAHKFPRSCATVDRYDPTHAATRAAKAAEETGAEGSERSATSGEGKQEVALPTARDVTAPQMYKPLALPLLPPRFLDLDPQE